MKKIHYDPVGICASAIDVVLNDDDTVESVVFTGGCPGNHRQGETRRDRRHPRNPHIRRRFRF